MYNFLFFELRSWTSRGLNKFKHDILGGFLNERWRMCIKSFNFAILYFEHYTVSIVQTINYRSTFDDRQLCNMN